MHDRRRRDGGSGQLLELLMLRDSNIACLDTRFSNPCKSYRTIISNSKFPALMAPSKLVKWLIMHSPIEETLFVMQPFEPYLLTYLPLPISLADEYSQLNDGPLPEWADSRYDNFLTNYSSDSLQLKNILSEKKINQFREDSKKYKI